MKKVLFTCTELNAHGGIQRFNRNLLKALTDSDVHVDIVSVNDNKSIDDQGNYVLYGSGKNKLNWCITLLRLMLANRYETIICGHINLSPAFKFLSIISFFNHRHSALILHGVDVWGRVNGLKKIASQQFDKVLAVSQYTLDSFVEQTNNNTKSKLYVFPNTISPEWLALNAQSEEKQTNQNGDQLILLSVTRLDKTEREKGIIHVLEALSTLKQHGHGNFKYIVIGHGDDRDYLMDLSSQMDISDEVIFAGSVSDEALLSHYQQANMFILPSSKEGFGIVFLEAMLFKLPVIGAAEKGALDVIEENHNGFLVPYENPNAIYNRLKDYFNRPELFSHLGENGYQMVTNDGKFSFSSFRKRAKEYLLT